MYGANNDNNISKSSRFFVPRGYQNNNQSGRWHVKTPFNQNNRTPSVNKNEYSFEIKRNSPQINDLEVRTAKLFWREYETQWGQRPILSNSTMKKLADSLEKELSQKKYSKISGLPELLRNNQGLVVGHLNWLIENKRPKQAKHILNHFLHHKNFTQTRQLSTLCANIALGQTTSLYSGLELVNHFERLGISINKADRDVLHKLNLQLAKFCKHEVMSFETFKRLSTYKEMHNINSTPKESIADALDAYVWSHMQTAPTKEIETAFQNHHWKAGSVENWIKEFETNRIRYIEQKHWTALAGLCTPEEKIKNEKTVLALRDFFEYVLQNKTPLHFYAIKLLENPTIDKMMAEVLSDLCRDKEQIPFARALALFNYEYRGKHEYEKMASFIENFQPGEANKAMWETESKKLWEDLLNHACQNNSSAIFDIVKEHYRTSFNNIFSFFDRFQKSELMNHANDELENPAIDEMLTEVLGDLCKDKEKIPFARSLALFNYEYRGEHEYEKMASFIENFQPGEANKAMWETESEKLWEDLLNHACLNKSSAIFDIVKQHYHTSFNNIFTYFDRFQKSKKVGDLFSSTREELMHYAKGELVFENNEEIHKRISFLIYFDHFGKNVSLNKERPILQIINDPKIKFAFSEEEYLNTKTRFFDNAIVALSNAYYDLGNVKTPEQITKFQGDSEVLLNEVIDNLPALKNSSPNTLSSLIESAVCYILPEVKNLSKDTYDNFEKLLFDALPDNHYKLKKVNSGEILNDSIFLKYENLLYADIERVFKIEELLINATDHNLPLGSEVQKRIYERGIDGMIAVNWFAGPEDKHKVFGNSLYLKFCQLGWFEGKLIGNSKAKDVCRLLSNGRVTNRKKEIYKSAFNYAVEDGGIAKAYMLLNPMLAVWGNDPEIGNLFVELLKQQRLQLMNTTHIQDEQILITQVILKGITGCSEEQKKEILNEIAAVYQAALVKDCENQNLGVGYTSLIEYGIANKLYDTDTLFAHLKAGMDALAFLQKSCKSATPNNLIELAKKHGLQISNERQKSFLAVWLEKIIKK